MYVYLVACSAELRENVLEHLELAGRAEHLCRSGQTRVKRQQSNASGAMGWEAASISAMLPAAVE